MATASPSMDGEREPVHNCRGSEIGALVPGPDGIWLEKRGLDPAKHMLTKPRGWATDAHHLELLRQRAGRGIRLVTNEGTTFTATLPQFDTYGFHFNRGHGPQVGLALARWQTNDTTTEGHQPPLFGDAQS